MPVVSLIVPCYNSSAFLSETVESLLRQELTDWELVLVDDGSKDSTWEIISRYVAGDPRITGVQKENGGTARARNFGFSRSNSSSRYLLFLDHDDQLVPDALSRMSTYLDAHPEVGLLTCQFQDVDADGRKLGANKRSRWAPGRMFPRQMRDEEIETPFVTFYCATGQGPFAMYRRSMYLQAEGWETGFWPHEDTDMFCQMALLGKVHCLPDRLYLKRIHSAQGMSDTDRVLRAYGMFRAKWDHRIPKTEQEGALLRDAKKYYYTTHQPCRDLKVAVKAFEELCRHPSRRLLWWVGHLLKSALPALLFKRYKTPV